jgi:integrase
MSDPNSTDAVRPVKNPERPPGETTLFWHQSGRWAKKIRGSLRYFGRGSYAEALELYSQQAADLHAGREPRDPTDPEHLTVYLLCGKFLATKLADVKTGELSQRSLDDYAETCKRIIKAFRKDRLVAELSPDDFEKLKKKMARTWGPVRLGNEMNRVRIVFSYGYKNRLIDRPMVFGEGFKRPSRRTLRRHRAESGLKMFEAGEIKRMIEAAGQPLKSMVYLGINCAFGNSDCATLPLSALDLDGGWLNYHRVKTGINRRIPLWPETVESLREWMSQRKAPEPKYAGAVFVTKYGKGWSIEGRALSNETRKLLDKLGINGHRNFYGLRHTFQTTGDESGDFIAVKAIMGHVGGDDISNTYRQRISDERLRKVTDHVRAWLFD